MTANSSAGGYVLDGVTPGGPTDVPSGTNLLLIGDETSGVDTLTYRLLATAATLRESVVLLTTVGTAKTHVEAYQSALDDPTDLDHLFVVDGSRSGPERETGPLSPTNVEAASSPGDVTGLGVGLSNHLRSIQSDRARVGFISLSPVVESLGPEKAFAFCHVLTSRIRNADLLGLFVVDPTRHEAEHVRILQSLVDGSVRVRSTDDGRSQVRTTGVLGDRSEWTTID